MNAHPKPAAETPAAEHLDDTARFSRADDDFGLALSEGSDPLLGEVLGDVVLVRLIATGGMGRVYEGRQRIGFPEQSGQAAGERTVAVKVIGAAVVSPGLLRRFDAEARLLARLDHPGIARIHGVGIHDVRGFRVPAIVMEFIPDAVPIISSCTTNRLPLRQRLAIFREVCAAVAQAHLRGVIHRDLKPGNILVASSGPLAGRPRVIDFGIARATDAEASLVSRQTDAGQLVGTLPYMSPEQLRGDLDKLDIRTDVYALGVLLTELLTGRLPHELRHKPVPEAIRIVHDEEPASLRSLDSRIPVEVEAIARTCLERDPERRYSSAVELADDVERYLEGRAVHASPPGFAEGLRRLARRHRAAATAAVASLVAVVVATIAIAAFAIRAEQQRRLAAQQRAEATRATERAERGRAAAEELVRFMTFNLRDQFADLGRPELMAGVLDQLGRYHTERSALAAAGLEEPTPEQRRKHEVFLNNIGDLERVAGRPLKAKAAYDEALAIAEALAAETPNSLEWQRDLSVSHQKLGMLAADAGNTSVARRHFETSRAIRERLVMLAPDDPTREWDLAGILDRLGELALANDDPSGAMREFTVLEAIMRRLAANEPDNLDWQRDLAVALQKLGGTAARTGNTAAAREHLGAAADILVAITTAAPHNHQWQQDLARTRQLLARLAAD
jgi:tetratricopeptide (TPR) repeat protein